MLIDENTTVENFSVQFQKPLSNEDWMDADVLERTLSEDLEDCLRLLRWAVVQVTILGDNRVIRCEGAYLKGHLQETSVNV